MSTPNPNAWPVEKEPSPADGTGVDDQAALAFEIAAMRVRASWDELDSPPADPVPTTPSTAPLDPFAPIVPGPASYPPPAPQAVQPALAMAEPSAVSPMASAAPPASLESAVDTAPMMFAQTAPVAANVAQQRRAQAQDGLPAVTFLPAKKASKPLVIAVALTAIVLLAFGLFAGGDDAQEGGQAVGAPVAESEPPHVEAPSTTVASPNAGAATPTPDEGRLTAVAPAPTVSPVSPTKGGAGTPTTKQKAVAATSQPRASEPIRASKGSDTAKRGKRSAPQVAHPRAQRHESASARAAKSKPEPKRAAPAQAETPKRKGTGFVSANPY